MGGQGGLGVRFQMFQKLVTKQAKFSYWVPKIDENGQKSLDLSVNPPLHFLWKWANAASVPECSKVFLH